MTARLNVNIDHVATVRQARRAPEPSLVAAAMLCEQAGADGITIHLRADRRHIQDADLHTLRRAVTTYLNVELSVSDEMIEIALDARPDAISLVPETPNEITTEGGLDVHSQLEAVRGATDRLREGGIFASIFLDPEPAQITAGHGLTYRNVGAVARIQEITEFNIGHNIISRAVLVGLERAVREMREEISKN
jgi:pyridoxine 5-phosphate synthase